MTNKDFKYNKRWTKINKPIKGWLKGFFLQRMDVLNQEKLRFENNKLKIRRSYWFWLSPNLTKKFIIEFNSKICQLLQLLCHSDIAEYCNFMSAMITIIETNINIFSALNEFLKKTFLFEFDWVNCMYITLKKLIPTPFKERKFSFTSIFLNLIL